MFEGDDGVIPRRDDGTCTLESGPRPVAAEGPTELLPAIATAGSLLEPFVSGEREKAGAERNEEVLSS